MADAVLLVRIELAERLVVAGGHEHRVVAEAAIAPRRPDQRAVDSALEALDLTVVGPGERQGAGEVGVAARFRARRLDLLPDALHGTGKVANPVFVLGPACR